MLKGKTAVVTGSTSGIGLGIATALAAEGCDIVMNGFGEPAAIERLRAGLAEMEMIAMRVGQFGDGEPAGLVLRHGLAGELRQLLQQCQGLQLQRIEIEGVAFGRHVP